MRLVYIFIFCLSIIEVYSQKVWSETRVPLSTLRSADAMYTPNKSFSVELDMQAAKSILSEAVEAPFSSGEHIEFVLPLPNGEMEIFDTYYAPVMEEELARKYPSIKTFKGLSKDKKSIARFGIGPNGFHASIRSLEGEIFIDKVSPSGSDYYYSYFTADSGEPTEGILPCGTSHEVQRRIEEPVGIANRSAGVELHTYRFALACIGRWGAIRGTKEKALADMVTLVNRVNQIYENEAAIRLILIADNDKIINLDENTDGYNYNEMNGNVEGSSLLAQNTSRLNAMIGRSNYDIGHVLSTRCFDVGGVAFLASACGPAKGAGVTCTNAGSGNQNALINVAQNTFAHEIGHQFAAPHTFNYCPIFNQETQQWEDTNASLGNDFEPGSGTTIMSYAGSCGLNNNISNRRDPYYNNGSLTEIYQLSRSDTNDDCGSKIMTENIAPEVNIPLENDFYIPKRSYFVLTGEATDANDDALSYNWEQHDAGNMNCQYGDPEGSCPLFRSLPAVSVPYRFFPREQRILSGTGDNSEILPSYKRDLTFALTVRDNNPDAGSAVWEYIKFKVDDTAGPFRVLSPGLAEEFEIGANMPVTWDVANTDNDIVNCKSVKIYLSLDKALHESDPNLILLAEGVPNTGEATVILPNVMPTNQARIVVKAQNNIFFDVTDFNFQIIEASSPRPYFSFDKSRDNLCLPGISSLELETVGLAGYDGNVRFEAYDLPNGITANFSSNDIKAGESISVDFAVDNSVSTGNYEWKIRSISDNNDTIFRAYFIDVISTDFSDLVSVGPEEGLKDSPGLPIFEWAKSINATSYIFELASNPSFDSESLVYNEALQDTFFETPDFLDKSSVFYWRVKAVNSCGEGEPTFTRSLGTVNLDCGEYSALGLPLNISASGTPSVKTSIFVPSAGQISDINISNISLTHEFFKDLKAVLRSPQGTEVSIWDNSCANKYNMNVAFDDDSPRFFDCANGISIFRPIGKLADFNNQNPEGDWELEITDKSGGNGGSITNVSLEICGSIVTNAPFLVNNEPLRIRPNNKPRIGFSHLLTEDDDNSPSEIMYTLVSNVTYGELLKNGEVMSIGESFTQFDLNEGRLFYQNTLETDYDSFYFTVEDGNGGWISITPFKIEIDENFPSSTENVNLEDEINIYPNPSSDFFNVRISKKAKRMENLQILDIHGRMVKQELVREGLQRINTTQLQNGVYLVSISDGVSRIVKKVVIQK